MPNKPPSISSLPTRYEPLRNTFGDKAKTTFVPADDDLSFAKRFISQAESSRQGKILFVVADSGAGKSTFVHSLEVFLADKVRCVERLPLPHELAVGDIPAYIARIPVCRTFTIVNFDGREAPHFSEPEYRTFLGALNGVLRNRADLLIMWPVTDATFAQSLISLLQKIGGASAFGLQPSHDLVGVKKPQFTLVLEKILQVANWRLDDAAVSTTEVDTLVEESQSVGVFLDALQGLIASRFDVAGVGHSFPTVAIVISSGDPRIRESCRSLRRADSYYIEASRLLMYTRKSNVSEWWQNRATHLKSALPHVIALFNAQLVSMSASSVVHADLQYGDDELKDLAAGVRADRGNARRVMQSSELYKFLQGEAVDNREYGSSVSPETVSAYSAIQSMSEVKHRIINDAILKQAVDAGATLDSLALEHAVTNGLQADASFSTTAGHVTLEFHHKAAPESTNNKIAIYVLEKLKEYAINYGLAQR